MKSTKNKVLKIKDLRSNISLGGVRFKHPQTGETCIWFSQWGYDGGKAGIFYKTDEESTRIFPLGLDNFKQALEFELVTDFLV